MTWNRNHDTFAREKNHYHENVYSFLKKKRVTCRTHYCSKDAHLIIRSIYWDERGRGAKNIARIAKGSQKTSQFSRCQNVLTKILFFEFVSSLIEFCHISSCHNLIFFKFCHSLSSQILSQLEFCQILSFLVLFLTIWVLS